MLSTERTINPRKDFEQHTHKILFCTIPAKTQGPFGSSIKFNYTNEY